MDREGFREGRGCDWGSQDERRPNPTKGTRPPLSTDREGFREDGERDLDGLERRIGLWGERGVLRLGMVSEGW